MGLRDEVLEQPAAARRLLDNASTAFEPISVAMRSRRPRFAVVAARGTSDNAGIYAQYLLAIRNALIVGLAAPSTITLYGARPNMADALVLGISQSGRSPDIVAVVDEARRQGALTVALTNDTDSPLTEAADHVIDLCAGPEQAPAATKTYTTELLAAALLSTALDPPSRGERFDLAGLPDLMATALTAEPDARDLAASHARRERAVVLGRGYSYPSAREWALKLQEMALVAAMAYSAAGTG
jgi:glucosamine--fructose-6-phosphate aminotransferase (isomerizing)